jgi:hypothetical protein
MIMSISNIIHLLILSSYFLGFYLYNYAISNEKNSQSKKIDDRGNTKNKI